MIRKFNRDEHAILTSRIADPSRWKLWNLTVEDGKDWGRHLTIHFSDVVQWSIGMYSRPGNCSRGRSGRGIVSYSAKALARRTRSPQRKKRSNKPAAT